LVEYNAERILTKKYIFRDVNEIKKSEHSDRVVCTFYP